MCYYLTIIDNYFRGMTITVLVTKLLGIYFIINGAFLMIKGKTIPHLLKDFFDHSSIVYLTGAILIFMSSIYLVQHNIWNTTLEGLVTLLVWVVMFKGLAYLFFPKMLSEIVVKKYQKFFGVYGLIAFIVGLLLFFSF